MCNKTTAASAVVKAHSTISRVPSSSTIRQIETMEVGLTALQEYNISSRWKMEELEMSMMIPVSNSTLTLINIKFTVAWCRRSLNNERKVIVKMMMPFMTIIIQARARGKSHQILCREQ